MEIVFAAFVCGGLIGFLMAKTISADEPAGTLRIDNSDPDGPYLFLELTTDPRIISQRKNVFLKVDTKSYISQ